MVRFAGFHFVGVDVLGKRKLISNLDLDLDLDLDLGLDLLLVRACVCVRVCVCVCACVVKKVTVPPV